MRLEEDNGTKTGKQAKGDILVSFFYDDGSECEATLSIDDALPIESTVKPEGCSSSSTRNGIRISFLPAPGSSADGLSLKVLKEDGTVLQSAQTASDGTLVSEGGTIPSSARTPKWVGNWDLVTSDGLADDQRNYDLQYVLTETEWTQVIVFDDGRCGVTRFSHDALQTYSDGSTVTQGTLIEADGLLYEENQLGADGSSELTIVNGSLRYEVKVDPNYQGNVSVAAPAPQSVETDLSARADCSSGPLTEANPAWIGDWELVDSKPNDPNDGLDDQRTWDLFYSITKTEWVQVTVLDNGQCGVTRFSLDNLQTAFADGATITSSTLQEADGILYSQDQVGSKGQAKITTATSSTLQYETTKDPNANYIGSLSKAEPANGSVETDLSARTDCSS